MGQGRRTNRGSNSSPLMRAPRGDAWRRRGMRSNAWAAVSWAELRPRRMSGNFIELFIAMFVGPPDAQHRGESNDESSSRSRSGRRAFSGPRIVPSVVPQQQLWTLWLRLHTSGSALRLCRSSVGDTEWVWAPDLHTTTLHTDSCLPSATSGARLLHSAVSSGFAADI